MFILAITPGEGYDPPRWRRVLASGIDAVMIREKNLEARPLLDLTRRTQDEAPGLQIWVNGRLDVALATNCGFHMPEAYPEVPEGFLPVSRPLHALEQFPSRSGAQQLILSPVFTSPGKGPTLGSEGLRAWLEALPSYEGRLLALGGITFENCGELKHPRLAGVAMIRSLWQAPDPMGVVAKLRDAWG